MRTAGVTHVGNAHVVGRTMLQTANTIKSAELLNKQMRLLFPTPMFTGMLPDLSLCDRIEAFLRMLQKSGVGSFSTPRQSATYMTPDDLHTRPEMKELVDIVLLEAGKIFDTLGVARDSHYINSMWGNITHPNLFQNAHVHPNSLLSGLVYIKTPEKCGGTSFASHRRFTKNFEPNYTNRNELNSDMFVVRPEKGRMLFWPSDIPHSVERGDADESEDRITLPFNIMIKAKIVKFTANLDLR